MEEIPQQLYWNPSSHSGKRFSLRFEYDASRIRSPWWTPIVSIILALLLCALFIAANGMNPVLVYEKMFRGAFGTAYGLTETMVKAIPLLLCGLGIAVAYRISVWNIGAEGQLTVGAMAATAVTIYFPDLPTFWSLSLMLLFGIAAGALWGLLTAIPRTHFGVNELITSLMLNYVALLALDYVVFGPGKILKDLISRDHLCLLRLSRCLFSEVQDCILDCCLDLSPL